jgi:hypothetical protein
MKDLHPNLISTSCSHDNNKARSINRKSNDLIWISIWQLGNKRGQNQWSKKFKYAHCKVLETREYRIRNSIVLQLEMVEEF